MTDKMMKERLASSLSKVRENQPLVNCITNFVTVNDCANIILASGGSPSMAHVFDEIEEAVSSSAGLVCNMGAIEDKAAMIAGGKVANQLGKPVVLDPVAAGGTQLRRDASKELLENVKFAAIRGNASEVKFLAGLVKSNEGIDSISGSGVDVSLADVVTTKTAQEAVDTVKELAQAIGSVVAISGEMDIISNGEETVILKNGCETMARITGSGCMVTSLIGAFTAANTEDYFGATVAAMAVMGIAGEKAEKRRIANKTGNATFRNDLIDAVFNMTEEDIKESVRYEIY